MFTQHTFQCRDCPVHENVSEANPIIQITMVGPTGELLVVMMGSETAGRVLACMRDFAKRFESIKSATKDAPPPEMPPPLPAEPEAWETVTPEQTVSRTMFKLYGALSDADLDAFLAAPNEKVSAVWKLTPCHLMVIDAHVVYSCPPREAVALVKVWLRHRRACQSFDPVKWCAEMRNASQ